MTIEIEVTHQFDRTSRLCLFVRGVPIDVSSFGHCFRVQWAGGPPSPPSPRVTVCGQNFSQTDFETFMNGNLVIVASYNAKGSSSAKIIQSLIFGMLFNGINFSDLASYSISFDNSTSTYTVGNGTASVSFTLYVTEDFTDSSGSTIAAGSPLPTNVFAMDSYVTNVGVNVSVGGSILHPTVSYSYSYDHGPLWALLSSTAVSISGSSGSDLRLSSPSLNTSILGISVNSQNTYTGTAPYIQDTIKLDMTTTDISLTDASAQFQAGDFGFSYAGTSYDSAFFGIEQEITGSMFYMTPGSTGWTWNGMYESTVTNSNLNMTLYQSGTVCKRRRTQPPTIAMGRGRTNRRCHGQSPAHGRRFYFHEWGFI